MSVPISTGATRGSSPVMSGPGAGAAAAAGVRVLPPAPRVTRGDVVVPLHRPRRGVRHEHYRAAARRGAAGAPSHAPDESPLGVSGSGDARRPASRQERPVTRRRSEAPAAGPLRLTRRGRVVVRLLVALAVAAVVMAGALLSRPALAGPSVHQVQVTERVVLPGETLWQIAGEVAPGVDRRETIAQIVDLNGLSSAAVAAGQRLRVPAEGADPQP